MVVIQEKVFGVSSRLDQISGSITQAAMEAVNPVELWEPKYNER
jgi:hypothetical protein